MIRPSTRGARRPLALLLAAQAALAACADAPTAAPAAFPLARASVAAAAGTGGVITVTTASGGTGAGSLRWAVAQAAGGETIRFAPALAGARITLDSTLVAARFVTIEGARDRGITISGGGRVQPIQAYLGMTLRNVTVTGGYTSGAGGIVAGGPLTLDHSSVVRNVSTAGSGGIRGTTVTLVNSTVAANQSPDVSSAITFTTRGTLTLVNSTVAMNGPAPAIAVTGSEYGYPVMNVENSVVAANGSANCALGFRTTVNRQGQNLFSDETCGWGAPDILIGDARLGALGHHGGPTETVDFLPQSPALNAGLECSVTDDQRYVVRDARCDLGAFEFTDFTAVTLTIDAAASVDPATGAALLSGTVRCSRGGDQLSVVAKLRQEQKIGRTTTAVVVGERGVGVTCATTAQPWRTTIVPTSGAFAGGGATAGARTDEGPIWLAPSSVAAAVKLGGARK